MCTRAQARAHRRARRRNAPARARPPTLACTAAHVLGRKAVRRGPRRVGAGVHAVGGFKPPPPPLHKFGRDAIRPPRQRLKQARMTHSRKQASKHGGRMGGCDPPPHPPIRPPPLSRFPLLAQSSPRPSVSPWRPPLFRPARSSHVPALCSRPHTREGVGTCRQPPPRKRIITLQRN